MKRKFLLLTFVVAIVLCVFTISVSAKEYNPTTYAELKAAFVEIGTSTEEHTINLNGSYSSGYEISGFPVTSNGKITINLTGNSDVGCRFNITGETQLVINLNTYTLKNSHSRGGDSGCQFLLNNKKATVEAYNGTININDVCFWYYNGNIICENVNITANEETIWSGGSGGVGNISFVGCTVASIGETFKLQNGSCNGTNTRAFTLLNSTFKSKSNGSIRTMIQCPSKDSVIRDCTFIGTFAIDSWCEHGDTKESPIIIDNIVADTLSIINGKEFYTVKNSSFTKVNLEADSAGQVELTLVDCKFNTVTWTGNATYKEKSVATAYTSANCENAGTKTVYTFKSTTSDTQYALDNPALGHDNQIIYDYANGFLSSGTKRDGCTKCSNYVIEATPALFTWKGYSCTEAPINGSYSVSQAFYINKEAIAQYNSQFKFGAVFAGNLTNSSLSFDVNGTDKSLCKDFTDFPTNYLDIKISGIGGDIQTNEGVFSSLTVKLVFCLYVIDNDVVYYINGNDITQEVIGISYSDIFNKNF